MHTRSTTLFKTAFAAGATALLCATAAHAAGAEDAAKAQYQREMQVCNTGKSNQDAATCKIEAEHALAEARRGGLSAAPGRYEQNALQRCQAFAGADRTDCEDRILNPTVTSGTAPSGGVLRESVKVVPAPSN